MSKQSRQTYITQYFIEKDEKDDNDNNENEKNKNKKNIIRGYNPRTDSWHCIECGIDMGKMNSRQFCGKIYCLYS